MTRKAVHQTREATPEIVAARATAMGALEAKVIPASQVYTGEWVRLKCQFGCGGYGGCLCCPPHSPTPEQTRRMLSDYSTAILLHGHEGRETKEIVVKLEREAFLSGYYKAFAMGCGPCYLCEKCAFDEGCRHPDEARPAMEACGIDVFRTARTAGFPIEVVTSTSCEQNYYALLLLE
jgi:predicted metal-binding protein